MFVNEFILKAGIAAEFPHQPVLEIAPLLPVHGEVGRVVVEVGRGSLEPYGPEPGII